MKEYYKLPFLSLYHADCMDLMAQYPDKYFDLAIVDPEFGIGIAKSPRLVTDKGLKAKTWDNKPIDMGYYTELFRVSKNQIIWGGNYYALPGNKHCIIWDKMQPEGMSFGMFDYAWTSFDGANKMFRYSVQKEQNKFHPTQKPVDLYDWILNRYSAPNQKILDTHFGSGSIALAVDKANRLDKMNLHLTASEIDKDYIDKAIKRISDNIKQSILSF